MIWYLSYKVAELCIGDTRCAFFSENWSLVLPIYFLLGGSHIRDWIVSSRFVYWSLIIVCVFVCVCVCVFAVLMSLQEEAPGSFVFIPAYRHEGKALWRQAEMGRVRKQVSKVWISVCSASCTSQIPGLWQNTLPCIKHTDEVILIHCSNANKLVFHFNLLE
jgi:hypothetical protein